MLFGEGEERFSGFFRYEGEGHVFSGEGPLLGAAEQQQCFGEVDRASVDGVEAVDEFAVVTVRILARHVEKLLPGRAVDRHAVLLAIDGRSPYQVAELLGDAPRSVYNWIALFRDEGCRGSAKRNGLDDQNG